MMATTIGTFIFCASANAAAAAFLAFAFDIIAPYSSGDICAAGFTGAVGCGAGD